MRRLKLAQLAAMALISSTGAFAGLADLVVRSANGSGVQINPATLAVSGSVVVEVENLGKVNAIRSFNNSVFVDVDQNGAIRPVDVICGSTAIARLNAGSRTTITIPLSCTLPSATSVLQIFVDSGTSSIGNNEIAESYEGNNIAPINKPVPVPVDLELSLAVDVSSSVDATEYNLQKQGYIDAFRNPAIINAIRFGRHGRIAVNYIEWANQAVEVVPFTLITDAASANAFADRIAAALRASSGCTPIGGGIAFAAARMGTNDYEGTRKLIDVSGDGVAGGGPGCGGLSAQNIEDALDQVDSINGVSIGDTALFDYYKTTVASGKQGFAIPAFTFQDFTSSILLKLQTEISGVTPPEVTISDLIARAKDTAVGLSWTPIPGAASYRLYRRTSTLQPYQLVQNGIGPSVSALDDATVVNGTTYFYSLRWVSASGVESLDSTEPSAKPVSRTDRTTIAPTILSKPVVGGLVGQPYNYQPSASTTLVGAVLRYLLPVAPPGMTINAATGQIQWTPSSGQVGYNTVQLRVEDQGGRFATQTFRVFISSPQVRFEGPPVFTSPTSYTSRRQYPILTTVSAYSPGGYTPIRYSVASLGNYFTVDPATGVLQGTAPNTVTVNGPYIFEVTATDSRGNSATQTIALEVLENLAPTITSAAVVLAQVGVPYVYDVEATDPEGDPLVYSLTTAPAGMTINSTTGLIQWAPTLAQVGNQSVTVRVTDPGGWAPSQSFTIRTVPPDTTPPVVTINSPAPGTTHSGDIVFFGTTTDDNFVRWTFEYQVPGDPTWILLGGNNLARNNSQLGTLRGTLLANNPYRVRLTAYDVTQSSSVEMELIINSEQRKLGDYTATFEDLRVPGLGIPVAINRKYDSKEPRTGDFGPAWFLDFTGIYLRTDVNKNVFLTLPDGRRVRFQFSPVPIGLNVYNNRYVAPNGVFDTLENTDCPQLFGSPPNFLCGGFAAYNPQNYILRTKAGFTYFLTATGGIQRIEDRNGNFLVISPTGITTNFGRDVLFQRNAQGRITQISEPGAMGTLRYNYDASGRLSEFIDQAGNVTRYTYDTGVAHYLTRIDDPLNRPVARFDYNNSNARLDAVCDANGNLATYAGCTRFTHGVLTQTILNARGARTDLTLDTRGNIVTERRYPTIGSTVGPLDTVRTYDANDNLLTERDPQGNTKTFTYDARGNRLTDRDPGGRTTTFTYNSCDKVATETDPAGNGTVYTYDAACNLRFVRDALLNTTEYRYNARGQRTHFIDPNGNTWVWAYDTAGLLTSLTDPFGKVTTFTFNSMGDLLARVDRNNRRIDFTYDAAHRLRTERWGTGRTATFGYNAAGQLVSASDPDSALTMAYDTASRLQSVDNLGTPGAPRVVMSYVYDANSNVTRVQDSLGGLTDYSYDGLDRLSRVTQSGTGVQEKRVDMLYDTASMLTELRRFSDLAGTQAVANTLYSYDCGGCAGRVTAIRHRKASDNSVIHDLTFNRDPLGNITAMTDAEGNHGYTYDNIRRLLTATHSNPTIQPNEFYNYDAVGNRLTSHLSNTHLYSRNRLIQDQQFTYLYDDEGNQIRKTDRVSAAYTEYVYDFRNRTTAVSTKTSTGIETARTEYSYDFVNRRVRASEASQTAWFVSDGLNPILKLTSIGQPISRRVYGQALDAIVSDETAGSTRWFLVDQIGTVRDLISNSSASLTHYAFDSYGLVLGRSNGAIVNDLLYTGREFTTALSEGFFRTRFYSPTAGRFLSEDLIDPYSYGYVEGNPLSKVDPLGLLSLSVEYSQLPVSRLAAMGATRQVGYVVLGVTAKEAVLAGLAIYAAHRGGRAAIILYDYYSCTGGGRECLRKLFVDVAKETPFVGDFSKVLLDFVKRL